MLHDGVGHAAFRAVTGAVCGDDTECVAADETSVRLGALRSDGGSGKYEQDEQGLERRAVGDGELLSIVAYRDPFIWCGREIDLGRPNAQRDWHVDLPAREETRYRRFSARRGSEVSGRDSYEDAER